MCKIVSLIILLQCSVNFIYNAVVTRQKTDTFTPLKKCVENECGKSQGYCLKSYGSCCEQCSCDNGLTFFEENRDKKCIKAIGHKEGNLNFVSKLNPCRINAPFISVLSKIQQQFLYSLKTSENLWLSDVFMGHRNCCRILENIETNGNLGTKLVNIPVPYSATKSLEKLSLFFLGPVIVNQRQKYWSEDYT